MDVQHRNRHLSTLVVNIEMGAKLSEIIEQWTTLGTSHDAWTMMGEERRRGEAKQWQDAARNLVNTG